MEASVEQHMQSPDDRKKTQTETGALDPNSKLQTGNANTSYANVRAKRQHNWIEHFTRKTIHDTDDIWAISIQDTSKSASVWHTKTTQNTSKNKGRVN